MDTAVRASAVAFLLDLLLFLGRFRQLPLTLFRACVKMLFTFLSLVLNRFFRFFRLFGDRGFYEILLSHPEHCAREYV